MRALSASGVIGLIIALSGCASQYGQESAGVPPEARIRVWHDNSCCANPVVGNLVAYDSDSLRLRADGSNKLIALSRISIRSVERPHRASHTVPGLGLGLILGGITGGIAGRATACSHCDGDWRGLGAAVGGAEGIILGGLAGAIIGSFVEHEEWEPVALGIPSAATSAASQSR